MLGVNVTLLAFAAERRAAAPLLLSADRAAIDRYILPAGHTAANLQQRNAAGELWDRRTPVRYIDPALHYIRTVRQERVCALLYLLNNGSCYSNGSVSPHRRRHTD